MRALGLDVGARTIGVAVSDPSRTIASARQVVRRQGQQPDARAIATLVEELEADLVVVGLPLELDGRRGHRARRVDLFVTALRDALTGLSRPVSVELWDERYSTAAAQRTLLEADVSRRGRKAVVDAVAAQFILQGYLDARSREAPVP